MPGARLPRSLVVQGARRGRPQVPHRPSAAGIRAPWLGQQVKQHRPFTLCICASIKGAFGSPRRTCCPWWNVTTDEGGPHGPLPRSQGSPGKPPQQTGGALLPGFRVPSSLFLFFFKDFIHSFMRDIQRGRDTGRGRSRLPARTRSQDPRITPWAKGRCSTTGPPGCPYMAPSRLRCPCPASKQWK